MNSLSIETNAIGVKIRKRDSVGRSLQAPRPKALLISKTTRIALDLISRSVLERGRSGYVLVAGATQQEDNPND
jgi:hypothetical protein